MVKNKNLISTALSNIMYAHIKIIGVNPCILEPLSMRLTYSGLFVSQP